MSDLHDHRSHHGIEHPAAWVARFAALVPEGEVLDLACGGGRHSRLMASHGHRVLAVDRNHDSLVLASGPGILTQAVDLETGEAACNWPFGESRFSGIVVANYLHRPLWRAIVSSLAPGGMLIYETFALGNELFGKPSNPDFLLRHGELLEVATEHGLHVIAYEDGYVDAPKPAMVQRLCAVKINGSFSPKTVALI